MGTVCVGAFLGQLDASIAGLVLPTLEDVFQAPVATVEWVAIAYLLTLAALVVPLGRLADLVGRKSLYSAGFLIFVLGSGLCGLAPTLSLLIVARIVQAVGAALLQANSVAIITAAVPRRELGRAVGIQGAAQAMGLSLGPSLGGLLIDAAGWQSVFLIAVPFGLAGAVLGWLVLPCTDRGAVIASETARQHFDWAGALWLGPAVALALGGLTFANTWGWTSPALLGTLLLAALCFGVFIAAELRASTPLVDLSLFRVRRFSLGLLSGLLSYAVLFGSLFLIPFYLERVRGHSAAQTGLLLSPVPIAIGVLAPLSGLLTDRIGSRLPTVAGMAAAMAALLGLALLPTSAPEFLLLGFMALLGLGLGLFTPPNNSTIMGSAPITRLGVAGGILNMTRSVGTSLGVAGTGAVLALRLQALVGQNVATTQSVRAGTLAAGIQQTLLGLAFVAAVAMAITLIRGAAAPRPAESTPALQAALSESIGL